MLTTVAEFLTSLATAMKQESYSIVHHTLQSTGLQSETICYTMTMSVCVACESLNYRLSIFIVISMFIDKIYKYTFACCTLKLSVATEHCNAFVTLMRWSAIRQYTCTCAVATA